MTLIMATKLNVMYECVSVSSNYRVVKTITKLIWINKKHIYLAFIIFRIMPRMYGTTRTSDWSRPRLEEFLSSIFLFETLIMKLLKRSKLSISNFVLIKIVVNECYCKASIYDKLVIFFLNKYLKNTYVRLFSVR